MTVMKRFSNWKRMAIIERLLLWLDGFDDPENVVWKINWNSGLIEFIVTNLNFMLNFQIDGNFAAASVTSDQHSNQHDAASPQPKLR